MEEFLYLSSKQLLFHPNPLSTWHWITCNNTFIPSVWINCKLLCFFCFVVCLLQILSVWVCTRHRRSNVFIRNLQNVNTTHKDYMVMEAAANFSCNVDSTSQQEMHEKIRSTLHITRLFVGLERAACDTYTLWSGWWADTDLTSVTYTKNWTASGERWTGLRTVPQALNRKYKSL